VLPICNHAAIRCRIIGVCFCALLANSELAEALEELRQITAGLPQSLHKVSAEPWSRLSPKQVTEGLCIVGRKLEPGACRLPEKCLLFGHERG
jgi:hypothetical protein